MTSRCLALDSPSISRPTCRCSGKCLGLFINCDGIACKSSPDTGLGFVRFFSFLPYLRSVFSVSTLFPSSFCFVAAYPQWTRGKAPDGAKNRRWMRSRPRQAQACLRSAAFPAPVFPSRPVLRSFPGFGRVSGKADDAAFLPGRQGGKRSRGRARPRKTALTLVH